MQQNFVLCMKRNSENHITNWNFMPFAQAQFENVVDGHQILQQREGQSGWSELPKGPDEEDREAKASQRLLFIRSQPREMKKERSPPWKARKDYLFYAFGKAGMIK